MGAQDAAGTAPDASTGNAGQPGGGIGNPVGTPDPLTKYKWWILGVLALLLAAAAAFFLRKPPDGPGGAIPDSAAAYPAFGSAAAKHSQLLNALKEEMFALESEKIGGTVSAEEYAKLKDALETVLRRALNRKQ
jgi:hypothetical protein